MMKSFRVSREIVELSRCGFVRDAIAQQRRRFTSTRIRASARRYSNDEEEKLRAMYAQGSSTRDMAASLNREIQSVRLKLARMELKAVDRRKSDALRQFLQGTTNGPGAISLVETTVRAERPSRQGLRPSRWQSDQDKFLRDKFAAGLDDSSIATAMKETFDMVVSKRAIQGRRRKLALRTFGIVGPELRRKVEELHLAGHTPSTISKHLRANDLGGFTQTKPKYIYHMLLRFGHRPRTEQAQKPWSEEEDQELKSMRKHNMPWATIAMLMDRTLSSCYNRLRILSARGDCDPRHRRWTEEDRIAALQAFYADSTFKEIAKRLGRSASAVHAATHAQRNKLEMEHSKAQ